MYLTSMNPEELYAEVRKDFIEISTQANMFMDRCRKKAKSMGKFIAAPQRMTITTTRNNVWTLTERYDSTMNALAFNAYAPIIGSSSNGYMQMTGFKSRDRVLHYTAHFMQRYKERYIDHYRIDLKGKNLLEYFLDNNPHVLYTRRNNGGYFIVSDQGIAVAAFKDNDMHFMTHITFLGDDELTLKKQLIYDEEVRIYKGAIELHRLKLRKQKDDPFTVWTIAKKYNAGFELVKRWYEWHGMKVPEDFLHECIDLIEKHHVQSSERLEELMLQRIKKEIGA